MRDFRDPRVRGIRLPRFLEQIGGFGVAFLLHQLQSAPDQRGLPAHRRLRGRIRNGPDSQRGRKKKNRHAALARNWGAFRGVTCLHIRIGKDVRLVKSSFGRRSAKLLQMEAGFFADSVTSAAFCGNFLASGTGCRLGGVRAPAARVGTPQAPSLAPRLAPLHKRGGFEARSDLRGQIVLCDSDDRPRQREVSVTVVGEQGARQRGRGLEGKAGMPELAPPPKSLLRRGILASPCPIRSCIARLRPGPDPVNPGAWHAWGRTVDMFLNLNMLSLAGIRSNSIDTLGDP